jgi:hypothetical protein
VVRYRTFPVVSNGLLLPMDTTSLLYKMADDEPRMMDDVDLEVVPGSGQIIARRPRSVKAGGFVPVRSADYTRPTRGSAKAP